MCCSRHYYTGQSLTANGARLENFSLEQAFSLVELVIVVVIIANLAGIAVPRISRGSRGAGDAALRASLDTLRMSIDMYAAEHDGAWPGADGK